MTPQPRASPTVGAVVLLMFALSCSPAAAQVYPQPEQVHLAIGSNIDEIVVTWVTMSSTSSSIVEYGLTSFSHSVKGSQSTFVDGGSEKRNIYMHRVTLTGLRPETRYIYHVGGPDGWSALYYFRTLPNGTDWAPRFALFGDMGNKNARSMGRLQEETQQGHFDMILHVGDFAYNMDTDNARYGDEFMRQIESIAAYVPYMTCAGNHEAAYNFSNYKARFSMPGGDGQSQFYSFNVGPVHFIYFDSEFYYFTEYGWKQIMRQYEWLEADLNEANKPENRAKRPWIIAMGHRPMYCSNNANDNHEHCFNFNNLIRTGFPIPGTKQYLLGLEDLFYQQGVDMVVAAHEHSYERMWPVYKWTVCNGTAGPYINPPAPLHIVTGSAGCQEDLDPFKPGGQPWSAFRSSDYGYSRFQVFNSTHLYLDQMSDTKGTVTDSVWLVKSKHGPGLYTCQKGRRPFTIYNGRFVPDWGRTPDRLLRYPGRFQRSGGLL